MSYDDVAALRRQLCFLASLRSISDGGDVAPRGLTDQLAVRETQLPHRLVNHAHAEARLETRMQVRILDHKRFLAALHASPKHSRSVPPLR